MKTQTALDWFNNELDNILELYPSEWEKIQAVFKEAKKKEKEKEFTDDVFTVRFAEWTCIYAYKYPECNFMELLEIYKKEKL